MSAPPFAPRALLERLVRRGVDFVVIGGLAVVLHGHVRLTRDLDLAFAGDAGNLEALGSVLGELDARPAGVRERVPFVADAAMLRRLDLLTLETELGRLDLHRRPPGVASYDELRRRAARHRLGDVFLLVAGLDDLIAMKRAAGRAQDLADLEALEEIRARAG